MNNHMMAAVLYGKENLQVEPVAIPTLEGGDVLVRVKVALTCGTDVKVFQPRISRANDRAAGRLRARAGR